MECGVSGRYFEVWIFFIVKSVQICKSNERFRSKHHMGVIDPSKWYSNSKILPLWNNDCDYSSGMRLKITQTEQKKGKNKYILTTKATKDNNNNTILIKLAGRQADRRWTRKKPLCSICFHNNSTMMAAGGGDSKSHSEWWHRWCWHLLPASAASTQLYQPNTHVVTILAKH